MTTDEALTDLARKINEEGWTCNGGIHEPGGYDSCIACQAVSNEVARVVLPIIRKAQADAWDEGEASVGMTMEDWEPALTHEANPYRTKEAR